MGKLFSFCILLLLSSNSVGMVAMGGEKLQEESSPTRLLLDTDMDTDDLFALLYLLKQNRSLIDLKAVTISANAWSDAGHGVNHLYDILHMMGRDDIPVGVGGEGGISPNGTILSNVGGFLPIIDQGSSTMGNCRYRQAVPLREGGRLDIDTCYGARRAFLPQGERRYSPLQQPTCQQVMKDTIGAGPTTVLLIGSHTNLAIFLMTNPDLKKNVDGVFVMGGGVNSNNEKRCCPKKTESPCNPKCGIVGNLFTAFRSNPFSEFNMFCDPFAAHMVFHSGIPITLVPLDATNTIPITKAFFEEFEKRQHTFEAQYCFQSLRRVRDVQSDEPFFAFFYLWDSFTAGVATSTILGGNRGNGRNPFAKMKDMFLTVVTSNPPYGIDDGSNPFLYTLNRTEFHFAREESHSGHVQMGIDDPFCMVNGSNIGRCQDGYTREVVGSEGARILVAQEAKPTQNKSSTLEREYYVSFLNVINHPLHSGKLNFQKQFPYYKEVLHKPDLTGKKLGKPVIFDMDMSPGDFLSLMFLLKVPMEEIDIKGVLVNGNGWANSASIDIVYDVLHMMGHDDIPVGLGNSVSMGGQGFSCRYIPNGGGGFLDSDTLYGLARDLPRSPRRYNAPNSKVFGGPSDGHPEPRQPSALEVWKSISSDLLANGGAKITVLTNGPLSNLANIVLSDGNATKVIEEAYIVGGDVPESSAQSGNVFSAPSNKYSEFNFFLDPLAAKTILNSNLSITLIPLSLQKNVSSFPLALESLKKSKNTTPELTFAENLLSTLHHLQRQHPSYKHMVDMFLGEILGAVTLAKGAIISATTRGKKMDVLTGDVARAGRTVVVGKDGNFATKVVDGVDEVTYYQVFGEVMGSTSQSAVIASFEEQRKQWTTPPTS